MKPFAFAALLLCVTCGPTHARPIDKLDNALRESLADWEGAKFSCKPGEGGSGSGSWIPFLSKETNEVAPDGKHGCDDADSVFFGGMLCLAGDSSGCDMVRGSQGVNGRWWRSPRQKVQQPREPSATKPKQKGEPATTFSTDAAEGVLAFALQTKDEDSLQRWVNKDSFQRWVNWIDKNERCKSFCGVEGPGSPRYCLHDNCYFQLADCAQMLAIGDRLGVLVPFCHDGPLPFSPREQLDKEIQKLRHRKDIALSHMLPIHMLGADEARRNFNNAFDALVRQVDELASNVDRAYSQIEQPLRRAIGIQSELIWINSQLDKDFHAKHNVLLSILFLEKLSLSDQKLHDMAIRMQGNQPNNPFFEYVAYRKQRGDRMRKLIFAQCPKKATDLPHIRTEWKWERKEGDPAWTANHSMYGECIFVAHLWLDDPIPPNFTSRTSDLQEVLKWVMTSRELMRRMNAVVETMENYVPGTKKPWEELKAFQDLTREIGAQKLANDVASAGALVATSPFPVFSQLSSPLDTGSISGGPEKSSPGDDNGDHHDTLIVKAKKLIDKLGKKLGVVH